MTRLWVLGLLLVVGCKGGISKDSLVGTWPGTVTISEAALNAAVEQAKVSSGGIPVAREQIKSMMESGASLTLNADDTFDMNIGPATYAGKWSLADKVVTLTLEKLMGMTIDEAGTQLKLAPQSVQQIKQPFKLNLGEKGVSMSGATPGDMGTTLTFTKSESKS
jgi:hypothetical protein